MTKKTNDEFDEFELETLERIKRALIKCTRVKRDDANDIATYVMHASTSFAILHDMITSHDEFDDDTFNERIMTCYALMRKTCDD